MFVKKIALVCTLLVLFSACGSETLVTKVNRSEIGTQAGNGVLFSLPETLVVAEVPVSRVSSSPGMFHQWTEFFYPELSSSNYITEEGIKFKLGTPAFTTRGQTDPDNVYMAHIKSRKFETKTLLLEFNDDGIVARTEASSKDETIDVITSGFKTAASIVAPLLPFGSGGNAVGFTDLDRPDNASDEAVFKSRLTPRALALYNSLSDDYRKKLREYFGYPFLVYVAETSSREGTNTDAMELFFTLNEVQWRVVERMPRSTNPCPSLPPGERADANAPDAAPNEENSRPAGNKRSRTKPVATPSPAVAPPAAAAAAPPVNCLAADTLVELARALKAYSRIQQLKSKRQDYLNETTPAQITNTANLEFRLKQLDEQIKTLEQTYFLGTTSETSATAKFEFKPTSADMDHDLFKYSAGGPKPGICSVENEDPGVFKALWPKSLQGDCYVASPNFQASDIRDLKGLAKKLDAGAAGDPVSAYLYTRLTNSGRLLKQTDTPQQRDALLRALIMDLNAVVNSGASIYDATRFGSVQLSAATIKLINTPGPTPAPLNRLLIEDAFAREIFKPAAWSPLQVTLRVDDPPPGFAQTVQAAQLTQTGKRGFPYRVPALTMARLIDNGVERGRSDVRVAQFGPVQTLPAALGGRRSSYKITYYDASGAIKVFDLSSDALIQKSNVTDLTDAATTLRDAEAARLKRETEILKARKEKLDAEKALREAQEAAEPSPSPTPTPSPE